MTEWMRLSVPFEAMNAALKNKQLKEGVRPEWRLVKASIFWGCFSSSGFGGRFL
jgi:hypothetical protein